MERKRRGEFWKDPKSQLELGGGSNVVKTWCVQSGNWTSAPSSARVVWAGGAPGARVALYPKYGHIRKCHVIGDCDDEQQHRNMFSSSLRHILGT